MKSLASANAWRISATVAGEDYAPTGVEARFQIPASHVSRDDRVPDAPAGGEPTVASLADLSILVVEDQVLIAMDLEECLARLGASDVRLSPNTAEARDALQAFAPDAAVLDFNLGSETAEALADDLVASGVPFVFATGYGDNVMIPQRFRHVPVVRKPVNPILLAAKLGAAMTAGAAPT